MANNFLKLLKPTANLTHNGFDLSQKHVFSSKVGQLVPCLAVETVPGDKFRIDLGGLMRSQTFNTAAFIRCRFSYDFFFVPYSQLWHPFNQFITQRDDKHSVRQLFHDYVPTIDLRLILKFIAVEALAVQAGNEYHSTDVFGRPMYEDAVRLLDMLGYGDFRWFVTFVLHQTDWTQDIDREIDNFAGQYVNLFRLAAYQHIFYDFYRNKYYDTDNTGGITPQSYSTYSRSYLRFFNFDDVNCSLFSNSHPVEDANISTSDMATNLSDAYYRRLAGLLTLRYAQWKHDLFTSVLPSQQFGAVSSVDVSALGYLKFNPDGNQVQLSSPNRYTPVDFPADSNAIALYTTSSTGVKAYDGKWSIPSTFDVLQLRKAESLQAWKQNTLRAGNQVQDSFRAHFGKESYYEADNEVKYLGSFDSKLDVREVSSTSNTGVGDNGSLGALAAQGISVVQGNSIEFNPSDYGVIVCVSQIVPDVDYKANMLDKANRLYEPFDFFTPEFQNIGLEAVSVVDYDNSQGSSIANDVLGFAPRYWMYKNSIDKVHGEFNDGSLSPWVAPRTQYVSNISSVPLRNFYVNPNVYDSVFGIQSSQSQRTDQFLHDVYFDIKAIRPMSELGLPQF